MIEDFEKVWEEVQEANKPLEFCDNKQSNMRDVAAILHLAKMFPGKPYMISASEHDQIYFNVSYEEFVKHAVKEDLELLRSCGVMIDDEYGLSKFV